MSRLILALERLSPLLRQRLVDTQSVRNWRREAWETGCKIRTNEVAPSNYARACSISIRVRTMFCFARGIKCVFRGVWWARDVRLASGAQRSSKKILIFVNGWWRKNGWSEKGAPKNMVPFSNKYHENRNFGTVYLKNLYIFSQIEEPVGVAYDRMRLFYFQTYNEEDETNDCSELRYPKQLLHNLHVDDGAMFLVTVSVINCKWMFNREINSYLAIIAGTFWRIPKR